MRCHKLHLRVTTFLKFVVFRVTTFKNVRTMSSILRMLTWNKQMIIKKDISTISILIPMIKNRWVNQVFLTWTTIFKISHIMINTNFNNNLMKNCHYNNICRVSNNTINLNMSNYSFNNIPILNYHKGYKFV